MQKEFSIGAAVSSKEIGEEKSFSSRKDVVKYLEEFIKSYKEKPSFVSLEIPNSEVIRLFGYKNVTTIKAHSFIVHLAGGECELGLTWGLGIGICRQHGSEMFEEALMKNTLASQSKLKKLADPEFESIVVAFSALNKKHFNLVYPYSYTSMRMGIDDLKVLADNYREQLSTAALLMKLEGDGMPPQDAALKVLETISTRSFMKACKEYGFEIVEGKFASDLSMRESAVKNKLLSFINKWQETNPEGKGYEFKADVQQIGADLCELALKRKILRYEISLAEDESRIRATEAKIRSEKEESDLAADRVYYMRMKTLLSNLKKALEIISKSGMPDEHNQP